MATPFPVDDGTLDLLWSAIFPDGGAERSSVTDLLTLYSQLGGGDPQYHTNDVLAALIAEVRRLRVANCRPYVCPFPGQHEHQPGDRWTCPNCGATYRLSKPIPRRWWRNWYAPLGRWKLVRQ